MLTAAQKNGTLRPAPASRPAAPGVSMKALSLAALAALLLGACASTSQPFDESGPVRFPSAKLDVQSGDRGLVRQSMTVVAQPQCTVREQTGVRALAVDGDVVLAETLDETYDSYGLYCPKGTRFRTDRRTFDQMAVKILPQN